MSNREESPKLVWPHSEHWTEEERQEANENLRQYVAFVLRVLERLEHDPEALARFEALTASRAVPTINSKEAQNNSSLDP